MVDVVLFSHLLIAQERVEYRDPLSGRNIHLEVSVVVGRGAVVGAFYKYCGPGQRISFSVEDASADGKCAVAFVDFSLFQHHRLVDDVVVNGGLLVENAVEQLMQRYLLVVATDARGIFQQLFLVNKLITRTLLQVFYHLLQRLVVVIHIVRLLCHARSRNQQEHNDKQEYMERSPSFHTLCVFINKWLIRMVFPCCVFYDVFSMMYDCYLWLIRTVFPCWVNLMPPLFSRIDSISLNSP